MRNLPIFALLAAIFIFSGLGCSDSSSPTDPNINISTSYQDTLVFTQNFGNIFGDNSNDQTFDRSFLNEPDTVIGGILIDPQDKSIDSNFDPDDPKNKGEN